MASPTPATVSRSVAPPRTRWNKFMCWLPLPKTCLRYLGPRPHRRRCCTGSTPTAGRTESTTTTIVRSALRAVIATLRATDLQMRGTQRRDRGYSSGPMVQSKGWGRCCNSILESHTTAIAKIISGGQTGLPPTGNARRQPKSATLRSWAGRRQPSRQLRARYPFLALAALYPSCVSPSFLDEDHAIHVDRLHLLRINPAGGADPDVALVM